MPTQSRFDSRALIDNRQVRIFLSSTFSDMEAERSALLRTFDALRVKARRRNVDLAVLDLRWGVTDEEARSGKVISVCLNEIEHSHPFFIGLLGSRYGYAPDADELAKNPDLLERYPWLADDIAAHRSITEMEMLYGVLRNEDEVDAAFYIRQSADPDDNPRQTALKQRVRGQRKYPVADYASVEELCTMVEREVTAMLDRHFPDVEATPLDRQRSAHRAYLTSRHAHFVGREDDLKALDDFVRSDGRHLVVTGDSGMGKSALMAEWIRRNEDSDDFNLVYHFLGNSFADSNYESLLRHLCDELYDRYGIERDPDRKEKLEDEAQRLMAEVMHHEKPLVVVIDGINQLSAPKDEKLLLWLPEANAQVKYIFTTLRDDDTMRTFERRGYPVHTLQPLGDGQRQQFLVSYLERVGKHLSPDRQQRILDDPESRNTLLLRTLLDELICFGSHEQLDTRIDFYLSAHGTTDFFDRVLQRYEQDYGRDLVRHALTLLALSERGLSEEELLAIAGLRQLDWHLFYCAAYNHLVVRGGLITFSHQYMATAVATRYRTTLDAAAMAPCRREIAAHFAALPPSDRRTSELAHKYFYLADWQHLHGTLVSFAAFEYFYLTNEPLLARYWRALLKEDYSLAAYLQLPHGTEDAALATEYNDIGYFISVFFADYALALEYFGKALEIREHVLGMEHPDTAQSYDNIGGMYLDRGVYAKALEYYSKALAIREKSLGKEHPDIANSYNNIGFVYNNMGDYPQALEYYWKAWWIEEMLGTGHPDTAKTYRYIGLAYNNMGYYVKAVEYHVKALTIKEKVLGPEHSSTAISYHEIGVAYDNMGGYVEAFEYYVKALAIYDKVFGTEHPSTAALYNDFGVMYSRLDDYAKALEYHGKALAIREQVFGTEHPHTASSYNNIGTVYNDMADYVKALEYYDKALAINEKVLGAEHPDTAMLYYNIGWVYYYQGDKASALQYMEKALRIYEVKLGPDHPDTRDTRESVEDIKSEMEN